MDKELIEGVVIVVSIGGIFITALWLSAIIQNKICDWMDKRKSNKKQKKRWI